jgi:transcriptional regulator with XRE-family HTH domain
MVLSPSQAFGQAAREIRKERGLSQEQAALDGGIDRAYYGHIERASKSATLRTIWRMADALGVSPSVLFARAEQILEAQSHPPGSDSA